MNENVKIMCTCELGYDKGALKKTIENNIFTIYGNLQKNNCIVLRYHGELIDNIDYENYSNDLYISYYFDNYLELVHTVPLAKCCKCVGENYCTVIELEEHTNISFEFHLNTSFSQITPHSQNNMTFKLDIKNNPLEDVLQKCELEETKNLPIAQNDSAIQIKKIINNIKAFFLYIFRKKDVV